MKAVFASIFVSLALLLAGCTYSNSDIYYVTPVAGDSASVVLTTNVDSLDPIIVSDSLLFKYSLQIEGGELYLQEASVSNIILYQHYTEYDPDTIVGPFVFSDSFWIYSTMAPDTAVYPMLFTAYYSANTNSLADVLGVEANLLEQEFELLLEGGGK